MKALGPGDLRVIVTSLAAAFSAGYLLELHLDENAVLDEIARLPDVAGRAALVAQIASERSGLRLVLAVAATWLAIGLGVALTAARRRPAGGRARAGALSAMLVGLGLGLAGCYLGGRLLSPDHRPQYDRVGVALAVVGAPMLVGVVLLFLTRAWARVGRGRYVLMTFALTLMGFGVVLVARTRLALVPVAILVTALGAPFVVARLQDLGLSARQYFAFLLVPFYGFPYLSFRLVFSPGRSGAAEAPTSAPVPPEGGASGADSAAGYPVTAVALAATLLAATGGYWWLRAGAAARDAGPALPETRPAPSVVAVASPPRPASPAAPAAPPDSTAGAGPPAVPATIPPGAKLSATVRSEAPAVDGTLDPQIVASVVKSRLGGLRACHQRALDRSRRVLSGRMVVHWTITGTGAVSGIDLETDTVGDAEMAGCVKALVAGWRFPRPADGSVEVAFPFVFQPSQ